MRKLGAIPCQRLYQAGRQLLSTLSCSLLLLFVDGWNCDPALCWRNSVKHLITATLGDGICEAAF